jgi:hypothetical protein
MELPYDSAQYNRHGKLAHAKPMRPPSTSPFYIASISGIYRRMSTRRNRIAPAWELGTGGER